jgi:hypothetical protein
MRELFTLTSCLLNLFYLLQMIGQEPEVSALLKLSNTDPACRCWLADFAESVSLLSAITLVTHPQLYHMGREAILKLNMRPDISEVLQT